MSNGFVQIAATDSFHMTRWKLPKKSTEHFISFLWVINKLLFFCCCASQSTVALRCQDNVKAPHRHRDEDWNLPEREKFPLNSIHPFLTTCGALLSSRRKMMIKWNEIATSRKFHSQQRPQAWDDDDQWTVLFVVLWELCGFSPLLPQMRRAKSQFLFTISSEW